MSVASTVRTPWVRARRAWAHVPLRARLVAILLAALLAALAMTGYGVQLVLSRYLVDQLDDQLHSMAVQVVNDPGLLRSLTNQNRPIPSPVRIQLNADDASVTSIAFGGYPSGQGRTVRFPHVSSTEASTDPGQPYDVTASDGSAWRAVTFPATLAASDGSTVTGTLTVAQNLANVHRAVGQLRVLTLSIGGIVIVVCALLGWLAIRRSFQPLIQVEETAAAIAAGDLSRRIPERPRTTEVGRLTASLNGMLAQIESAFRARAASEDRTRRFAADASHELRTPLAAIRGYAELYRQGAVPPSDVPRTMQRIEDEARRMGGLVEDLLLLARLDARRPAKAEPVDLAVLAGDAVHDARGLAPDRSVRLVGLENSAGPVPAVVIGDEGSLRQVVTNLVANAVRHTPSGTPIEVAVGTEPGDGTSPQAVLEVRDHGAGLPPDEAERVFERFYRMDSSRQRAHGGGSGLGLSIVAAVTAAHDGTVGVLATPGGGATFRVALPLAPSPDRSRDQASAGARAKAEPVEQPWEVLSQRPGTPEGTSRRKASNGPIR
jgi:two-component system OmpR family sensor kinase